MNRNTVIAALTALGAIFFLVFGLWPFFDARSFFDEVATYEPYNEHFLHDIGAFQVGIGATLALALWRRTDALFVALAGAGIGSAFHAAAHFRDHDLEGASDGDAVTFTIIAVLLLAGAAWRLAPRRAPDGGPARTER
ncbi:MAG: hypothetical protein ACR2HN_03130 [Tepidiformaceae bacterium]